METPTLLSRHPEFRELIMVFRHEVQKAQRPANEIILIDEEVMRILSISKRTLCYMRERGEIPYHQSPQFRRSYYLLSDILNWLKQNRKEEF